MLEVHIDTEGGEHSMPFLKDTSRYELHRMIPFGRAVSYCFAASADGTPGTTPMYFTVDSAPSINLRDLKASDLAVFVRGEPPLERLNYTKGSSKVAAFSTGRASRHEGLRAIAGHSRRFNPTTSGLAFVVDSNIDNTLSRNPDDAHDADFSRAAPRLNELLPPAHVPIADFTLKRGLPDMRRNLPKPTLLRAGDNAQHRTIGEDELTPAPDRMLWIASPSTSIFRCRSYGGQRPPIYFDSTDILNGAFEADWLRFSRGGFLDGVGIKGMPIVNMFQKSSMLDDVRKLLHAKYPVLMNAFKFYSSKSVAEQEHAEDAAVTLASFHKFCQDAMIGDDKFSTEFIERTWRAASPIASARAPNVLAPSDVSCRDAMEPGPKEEALERFEFCIQALILIAKAKYLDVMRAPNIRDALKKLLSENISVAVCSEATGGSFGCRDEDVFRRENLYIEAVDTVFTRHEAQLRALFEFGAKDAGAVTHVAAASSSIQTESRILTFNGFRDLWNAHFNSVVPPLSDQALKQVFLASKLTVVDELAQDGWKVTNEMTFDDFLESLVRLRFAAGLESLEALITGAAADLRGEDSAAIAEAVGRSPLAQRRRLRPAGQGQLQPKPPPGLMIDEK